MDVHADGEYKLLVADSDRKLKVYKGNAPITSIACHHVMSWLLHRITGTSIVSEHALLDQPSALATFYSDLSKPQVYHRMFGC